MTTWTGHRSQEASWRGDAAAMEPETVPHGTGFVGPALVDDESGSFIDFLFMFVQKRDHCPSWRYSSACFILLNEG